MADYVSIDEFNQGWKFFIRKIKEDDEEKYGDFPCSNFSCSGCDDWLDSVNQNRNADKF